jgi:hypothetical protein
MAVMMLFHYQTLFFLEKGIQLFGSASIRNVAGQVICRYVIILIFVFDRHAELFVPFLSSQFDHLIFAINPSFTIK